ncbi:MAG: 1-acyl-sn-glycerol-3-phosphate acyltransferase [Dysgonamonadaceae bacterium]|jgi:putative hemolysin|nr:1-acyl-sn-glycerol-3-phosphate acyltransferase [Dysgonamonadaceae bacterium]
MSATQPLFLIDIEKILKTKAPQVSRKIPKFVVRWFERLIRQKDMNDFLIKNNGAEGVDFMNNLIEYFNVNLKTEGEENIPQTNQRFIFAANHPLGGLDGVSLSAFLGNKYDGKIKYLVNDILYFLEPVRNIFVPINKHGRQAKGGVGAINEALASDDQIITFPAGICSRKQKGEIKDLEWKKMFIVKAVEYKRDVIPVYFEAKNSAFFYRLANIRKSLGIKFNIEMLFLPREMFKSIGSTFTIHFGQPIPWETFDSSKSPSTWAREVKKIVYELKK